MAIKNINFDDGYKSFTLNGDKQRVIRFNPADPNFIKRAMEAEKRISQSKFLLDDLNLNPDGTPEEMADNTVKAINEFEEIMKDQINYIFNADVYDTVFAGQSPLCIVGKNRLYIFEAFMDSVIPVIAAEIEEYNKESMSKVSKYTKGY